MAKLEKISDDVFNGEHPNGINAGFIKEGNIYGELIVARMFMVGSLRTSHVTEIVSDTGHVVIFKTNNSTYKLTYATIELENRRTVMLNQKDVHYRRDYLSVDKQVAISSEGMLFKVGDIVGHDGDELNETSAITEFSLNEETMDVMAHSEKGVGRISFLHF